MPEQIYNLDSEQEYFKFTIFGYVYMFRYMTSEETSEWQKLSTLDDKAQAAEKSQAYLLQFIAPEDPKSPPFTDTLKKMKTPNIKKFFHMLTKELGEDAITS